MLQTQIKYHTRQWKSESISSENRNKKKIPLSSFLFNIVLEVLATAIREKNKIKGTQIWKEGKKIHCLQMTWCYSQKNQKTLQEKPLDLINEFCKFAGYKINRQKSAAFLCTNNKISERQIKETISFTIESKRIKYLGKSLPKEKKIYTPKTITHWWNKMKMAHRWKDIPCSWIEIINSVYMAVPSKVMYRFNAIPVKLPKTFFAELEQKL